MRVFRLDQIPHRPVEANSSTGFAVGALGITAEAHLVVVRLAPGGVIGQHPAVGRQILLVVDGDATVTGADDAPRALGPGEAAVWEPGEPHTTTTEHGLLGFVVEGDLDLDTRPGAVDAP